MQAHGIQLLLKIEKIHVDARGSFTFALTLIFILKKLEVLYGRNFEISKLKLIVFIFLLIPKFPNSCPLKSDN